MRRLAATAAMVAAIALVAPVLRAQVRNVPAPDSHNKTSKSSSVPARPRGGQGAIPTPIGVSPSPNPAFPTPTPIGVPPVLPPPGTNNHNDFHHHHRNNFVGGAYPVYVPVPVVVDPYSDYQSSSDQDQSVDEQDDQNVVPGPTVFERRTPQAMSDVSAPTSDVTSSAAPQPAPSAASPAQDGSGSAQAEPAQPASVLVFRDGHQLEVENYAIVGNVLYDFTPGHARKVPLSLLDLDATVKANDDRGVDFVVPASAKGN